MKLCDIKPLEGRKIRRNSWESEPYYWVWKTDKYFDDLHLINMKGNAAKICRGDIESSDWIILDNEIKNELDAIRAKLNKIERGLR